MTFISSKRGSGSFKKEISDVGGGNMSFLSPESCIGRAERI